MNEKRPRELSSLPIECNGSFLVQLSRKAIEFGLAKGDFSIGLAKQNRWREIYDPTAMLYNLDFLGRYPARENGSNLKYALQDIDQQTER
jgi:hypothetical protein